LILLSLGSPDPGPVFANYIGYILVAMSFFAVGFLASTMSENQMVSAVIAYGMLIMLWVIGVAGGSVDGKIGDFFKYLSIFEHTGDFFSGVIDLTHVFYFLSLIFLSLFFSVKVLEGKRN
jgi:ABC-2 type transport system permease protein